MPSRPKRKSRKQPPGPDDVNGLPASLAVAWGLRDQANKGPRRGLSVNRIVEAAVKVALTDGLAAVSMNRVGRLLGGSAMSLYRYVAAKDELLALMVDFAYGPPPVHAATARGWRAQLGQWAWANLAVLRRHPWVLRIPISGPPMGPNQVRWLEAGLSSLRTTQLSESEKLSVIQLFYGFVRNQATLEANVSTAHIAAGSSRRQAKSFYGAVLGKLTDPHAFPSVNAVIAAGVFNEIDQVDAEFVFGLDRLLDGVSVLLNRRQSKRAHV